MNPRGLLDDLRTAAAMPRVEIVLSRGRPDEEAALQRFRSRHPRYKVVGLKAVGAALLPLDDITDVDDYLATRRYARRRVRRAAKLGYRVGVFDPDDRRSELLDIHSSLPERQGRAIDADYLDPDARWETGPHIDYLGVFREDALVAYGKVQYAGDIATLPRLMGHGDHLDNGVMFLLMADIVMHVRSVRPHARYLFYDMFFGASAGLREFKSHLGFQPHYVRWTRGLSRAAVKRVCHITTVHPVDDHRILHKECVSLRDAGYDVSLIAPHAGDAVVEGITVVGFGGPVRNRLERTVRRPRAAYRAAVGVDADLYHFHDPDFLPFAVRLARSGKRVVYDAHEDVPTQIRSKDWIPAAARPGVARAFARLEAACVARLDAVVSPSRVALDRLRPRQPRVALVENHPRLGELMPAARWDDRLRAVCYVGGITRVRGAHELVDAMAHVEAELHLAGAISPPGLRDELERSAGWPRVRYLGRVPHARVPELLARVKLGVIPLHPVTNYVDAYPVKLFEYLAAGLPVIATDVPRWREVLEAHDCGVCVPHGSPKALAAAIATLLDDDERARAMGARARRAAEEHYSWDTQASTLLELYAELLS